LKCYKNYKNRLRLVKVIVKNKMSRFFMVHCVHFSSAAHCIAEPCGIFLLASFS